MNSFKKYYLKNLICYMDQKVLTSLILSKNNFLKNIFKIYSFKKYL